MMYKRATAIIIVIILLLLLWWYLQSSMTVTEPGWVNIGNPVQLTKKIHEETIEIDSILWDECCEGTIKVDFEYMWEFYDDDWTPTDDCCEEPVQWTVRDSYGKLVFDSESCSPVDIFGDPHEITTGEWDCIRPWRVTIINGCLYPINYKWEMTMWCYE